MMYAGKYPDTGGLPPGYRGVACTQDTPSAEPQPAPCLPEPVPCEVHDGDKGHGRGWLEHLFSHKLDMEDLLLLALIVLLLNSGADMELILMLALLFVMGLS